MEFLYKSFLETTTQLAVTSNTITSEYLMDPDVRRQFVSSGDANDTTTTSITISFTTTQTVDRIAIMEHNIKTMNIFYNGATANAFTMTSPTTTSQFTSNSATNLYLACTQVAVTSVTFDLKGTITPNTEKAVGYIYVGGNQLTFDRLPNASNYTFLIDPKDMIHNLSDGGIRRQTVQTKRSAKLKLKYVTESFKSSLLSIYNEFEPKVFVPFGTGTAWDGILFECNWLGNFDFYKYADDNTSAGFDGSIDLKET